MLASLGQDDRRATFIGQPDCVSGDQVGALLVCGERAVDLLDAGVGWEDGRIEARLAADDSQPQLRS